MQFFSRLIVGIGRPDKVSQPVSLWKGIQTLTGLASRVC
jgi:hypothetical protein